MFQITSQELINLVATFIWPFSRILGLFSSAPLLSQNSFPVTTRIGLAIAMTILIMPEISMTVTKDPLSMDGLLILINQFLIGISIGFVMRVIFAGLEMAGELIGVSMGLGFATFYNPQTQGQTIVISQFLSLVALAVFLSTNLHLVMLESFFDSFKTIPINQISLAPTAFRDLAYWGSHVFSIGLQLSLPIVTTLLIANIALGILTKAAPQLNLFGIGFPITIGVGFLMLSINLPYWSNPIINSLDMGIQMIRQATATLAN
jgi:flagellar biosynthetic protein FliR